MLVTLKVLMVKQEVKASSRKIIYIFFFSIVFPCLFTLFLRSMCFSLLAQIVTSYWAVISL